MYKNKKSKFIKSKNNLKNNKEIISLKDIKLQTKILVVSICTVVLAVMGTSYAAFVWNNTGSNQSVSSGNYTIEIENTSGTTINLTNAYPLSNELGEQNTPYKFTIKNNSNTDVEFSLKLVDDTTKTNTLSRSYINVNLSGSNTISSSTLSWLPNEQLDAGILPANSSKSYELRIWIISDAPNDAIGKSFNGKLTLDTKQIEQTGITYPVGDVNMNGVVDYYDASMISDYWLHRIDLTEKQKELADTNGDNTIDMSDATTIIQNNKDIQNTLLYKIFSNSDVTMETPDFDSIATTDEGLIMQVGNGLKTKNGFPVYYFRGAVTDNYVNFAGSTWRIVRINEDGTIRMIKQDSIGNSSFNSSYLSDKYVGYTYDNSNPNIQDGTSSIIKQFLENWYNSNLNNYDEYIATTSYCNDTSVTSTSGTVLQYGMYDRLVKNKTPIFTCPDTEKTYGGEYNLKIGLISADEVAFAGGKYGTTNTNYYLYNSSVNKWTLSPFGGGSISASVYFGSNISSAPSSNSYAVHPVINLKADVTATGTGTSTDPYVVG